jgi:hypothetical protein
MLMMGGLLGLAADELVTREIFGNHSLTSQRVFYALSIAALVVFGWGCYRRAQLWRLGRRGERKIDMRRVAKHLLFDALLQRRVLGRGWASLGHVLIFAGFMGLFLATVLLSIEHWLAGLLGRPHGEPVFHKGTYYVIYEALADGFGLALLAGGRLSSGLGSQRHFGRLASMRQTPQRFTFTRGGSMRWSRCCWWPQSHTCGCCMH